jgi:hypothetical protein
LFVKKIFASYTVVKGAAEYFLLALKGQSASFVIIDELLKSWKFSVNVIPTKAGSDPGPAPVSRRHPGESRDPVLNRMPDRGPA